MLEQTTLSLKDTLTLLTLKKCHKKIVNKFTSTIHIILSYKFEQDNQFVLS